MTCQNVHLVNTIFRNCKRNQGRVISCNKIVFAAFYIPTLIFL